MPSEQYTIGVIGGGVVGQAVANFFPGARLYDKFKTIDPIDDVLRQDIIFICVPTPYERGFDRSALDDVFSRLSGLDDKIIVIKSTVIPGTTDYYQEQHPKLKVLFNPEFLTERTANEDFIRPDKQLVGFTEKSQVAAKRVLSLLPDAPYKKQLPARAAELVKYAVNSYYASKVIFGNLIYDLAEGLGVDYNVVKEAFTADKRITDSHFDVWHGGYRGYDGKCLPKDLKTLRDFGQACGVDVSLLEVIDRLNQKYNQSKQAGESQT